MSGLNYNLISNIPKEFAEGQRTAINLQTAQLNNQLTKQRLENVSEDIKLRQNQQSLEQQREQRLKLSRQFDFLYKDYTTRIQDARLSGNNALAESLAREFSGQQVVKDFFPDVEFTGIGSKGAEYSHPLEAGQSYFINGKQYEAKDGDVGTFYAGTEGINLLNVQRSTRRDDDSAFSKSLKDRAKFETFKSKLKNISDLGGSQKEIDSLLDEFLGEDSTEAQTSSPSKKLSDFKTDDQGYYLFDSQEQITELNPPEGTRAKIGDKKFIVRYK